MIHADSELFNPRHHIRNDLRQSPPRFHPNMRVYVPSPGPSPPRSPVQIFMQHSMPFEGHPSLMHVPGERWQPPPGVLQMVPPELDNLPYNEPPITLQAPMYASMSGPPIQILSPRLPPSPIQMHHGPNGIAIPSPRFVSSRRPSIVQSPPMLPASPPRTRAPSAFGRPISPAYPYQPTL